MENREKDPQFDRVPDYDVMDMSEGEELRLIQPEVEVDTSDLKLENTGESPSPIAIQISNYALELAKVQAEYTAYSNKDTNQENPLNQEFPIITSNTGFIYWLLNAYGVQIKRINNKITMQSIKQCTKLDTIAYIGSYFLVSQLMMGDIIFLGNKDNSVAVYVGNGKAIGFFGKGYRNFEDGLKVVQLIGNEQWKGHVKRIKR